jgi:TolB protein
LERSGQFRSIDASGAALDESSRPDVAMWRQKSADSLATGSITRMADGRYDVRFRLWDVVRGQDLGGQSFVVTQGDLRLVAHRIADFIYEKLTGERGVFSTRITYVTKTGSRYSLWVADADGENAQSALSSPSPSSCVVSERRADRLRVFRITQARGVRARCGTGVAV